MHDYFKKGKNATEAQKIKKVCAGSGEGAVADHVKSGLQSSMLGISQQDDAPRSGRPVEVDSDQIETLIENDQHSTPRKTAEILKVSKSTKLSVKVKHVSFILQKKLNRLFGQPNSCSKSIC